MAEAVRPGFIENPSVARVRRATERVLARDGVLTVYRSKVRKDITGDWLAGNCEDFSKEIRRGLLSEGIKTNIVYSADTENPAHWYLLEEGVNDIIVDSTFGQIVEGYYHVFVDTRMNLRKLMLEQTNGNPYKIDPHFIKFTPQFLFEEKWGSSSVIQNPKERRTRRKLHEDSLILQRARATLVWSSS